MQVPQPRRGLRWLTIGWALYAAIWIPLEGELRQVLLLAVWTALLLAGHSWQRLLAGRRLGLGVWLLATAAAGLLVGAGSSWLALGFMALKTGLHAHGPEFNRAEIDWVLAQSVIWDIAGLLAGLGFGLVSWRQGAATSEAAPAAERDPASDTRQAPDG